MTTGTRKNKGVSVEVAIVRPNVSVAVTIAVAGAHSRYQLSQLKRLVATGAGG